MSNKLLLSVSNALKFLIIFLITIGERVPKCFSDLSLWRKVKHEQTSKTYMKIPISKPSISDSLLNFRFSLIGCSL